MSESVQFKSAPDTPQKAPATDVGILVGRVSLSKYAFEYVIVPRRDDIDVFVTTLPVEILKEMYTVNTLAVNKILSRPYFVEFRWKTYYTNLNQIIYKAFIMSHKRIEFDLDNPLDAFKQIDPDAEYTVFEEPPVIDQNFLLSLSRSTGASITAMPKRFYSIGVASKVAENGKEFPIYMNLAECFLWLQGNVSKIRGVVLLPTFKYAVVVVDPIDKEELKNEILNRINTSVSVFRSMMAAVTTLELPTAGEVS